MDAQGPSPDRELEGWVFLRPEAVPDEWRDRAVPVVMVPLFPGEGSRVLGGRGEALDPHDERVLRLVARGRPIPDIAAELGVTARSIERRVARLRKHFDVGSTAELTSLLARRGIS